MQTKSPWHRQCSQLSARQLSTVVSFVPLDSNKYKYTHGSVLPILGEGYFPQEGHGYQLKGRGPGSPQAHRLPISWGRATKELRSRREARLTKSCFPAHGHLLVPPLSMAMPWKSRQWQHVPARWLLSEETGSFPF